jgi:hypothetical protein
MSQITLNDMIFFLAFGAKFISCWIRIRIRNADPDPGYKSNADPCGSGYETLLFWLSCSTYPVLTDLF